MARLTIDGITKTFGTFRGSLLRASERHNEAFRRLGETQPRRPLPFRYGYKDSSGQNHLVVTRRPDAERSSR